MREKTEEILPPYRLELARNLNRIRDAWYAYALRFCEQREYIKQRGRCLERSVSKLSLVANII